VLTVALALQAQAGVASALGQHGKARQLLERAIALADGAGPWRQIALLVELGETHLALGEAAMSRRRLCQALALASATGLWPRALSALAGAARLLAHEDRPRQAMEILALVLQHPATLHATKDRAQRLFTQLESTLSATGVASATARGPTLDLEETMVEMLEECTAEKNSR